MKRLLFVLAFATSLLAQTVNTNILPATTGLDLGSPTQQWDGFFRNVNIYGTFTPIGGIDLTAPLTGTQTVTDSSVSNNFVHFTRTDNSPPVDGAGILNAWLAPAYRFDVISQSNTVTGSTAGILAYMPAVKTKTWTTTTQGITASGSPQTVSVADSSVFSVGEYLVIDPGQGGSVTEYNLLVTAVPDSTHITATFSNNHTSGARIAVTGKGDKIAIGSQISDASGNTSSTYAGNFNCTYNSTGPIGANCVEIDSTVNVVPGAYYGDRSGPYFSILQMQSAGTHNTPAGLIFTPNSASANIDIPVLIGTASKAGVWIENAGGGVPPIGVGIASASNYGVIIGSNQNTQTNPNFVKSNPTYGIYLTAKGTSGTADSNNITLQSLDSSSASTMTELYSHSAGGWFWKLNGTTAAPTANPFIGYDYTINTPISFILRDTSTAQAVASFESVANAAVLSPKNAHTLDVQPTTLEVSGLSTTGSLKVGASGSTISDSRNLVQAVYSHSGSVIQNSHIVVDTCTLGTSCSVTLTGSAVFTNSTSYACTATDKTAAAAVQFTPSSGSAFTLTGTGTDVLVYTCIGN